MHGWSDNIRGAILMMTAMSLFAVNDSFLKGIGTGMSVWQVLFLRGIGASVLMLLFLRHRGVSLGALSRRDLWLAIGRAVMEAMAAVLFVSALQHMPFANLSAIQQALPLAITLAGVIFLREPVGWRRSLAIGIGLLGVLIIVRPGTSGFNAWSIPAMGTVLCVTARDIFARMLSPQASTLAVAAVAAIGVMAVTGAMVPFVGWDPVTPVDGALLAGATLAVFVAYIISVGAMRVGDIGFVSLFRYFGLLFSILAGVIFFAEIPDVPMLVGAAVIVGSGLYTLWRERRLAA